MIYSPDHNFLLIKNLKVGGTSLEVELSKVLPDNAIVTKIYPENISHKPRNDDGFYNHISYIEIKNKLDLLNVKSYVVVRNPYTSVLSDFFFRLKVLNIDLSNIKEKVSWYFNNHLLSGTHKLYTQDNKVCVDKILFYENNIENEINKILPEHGINQISIKTFEKNYRPEWATYQELFNREQIDAINKSWEWEFSNLGYRAE